MPAWHHARRCGPTICCYRSRCLSPDCSWACALRESPPCTEIGAAAIHTRPAVCQRRSARSSAISEMLSGAPARDASARRADAHLGALIAIPIALLLWVLPFHAILIAFFFGVLRTGMKATMIMAAWKECVVVLLFGIVVMRSILSRGPGAAIIAPDVAVAEIGRASCRERV